MRYLLAILFCLPAASLTWVGGETSKLIEVQIVGTDGAAETGITFGTVTVAYTRNGASSDTDVTEVTMTMGTWVSGGWVEVDATNSPGLYQFGVPNAAILDGADYVTFFFTHASTIPRTKTIELTDIDNRSGVAGWAGITALATAQTDLDTLTGSDGATLATAQGNYAPNVVVPPTEAQMNARTLATADYFIFGSDTVTNVGTVATLTGHTVQTADHTATLAGLNDITAADVWTTGSRELSTPSSYMADVSGLATTSALATLDTVADTVLVDTNELQTWFTNMIEADGADFRFVTNALEQAPSGGGGGDATAANQTQLLADVAAVLARGNAAWVTGGGGAGAVTFVYTLTDSATSDPLDDVLVEVFTEVGMSNRTASLRTDAFGVATFALDAGTYYLKRSKGGYTFTNPDSQVVAE